MIAHLSGSTLRLLTFLSEISRRHGLRTQLSLMRQALDGHLPPNNHPPEQILIFLRHTFEGTVFRRKITPWSAADFELGSHIS